LARPSNLGLPGDSDYQDNSQTRKPTMHCQDELEQDLGYSGFIPDSLIFKWFNDHYSASKHLLTLYTMARGLNAKTIVEVGFGRTSFVLARAAFENGGQLITCDQQNFSYLLSEEEQRVTRFVHGPAEKIWDHLDGGIDFAFLDFFSDPGMAVTDCVKDIEIFLSRLKTNGMIAIHDAAPEIYPVVRAMKLISANSDLETLSLPFNYGLGLIRNKGRSKWGAIHDRFFKKPESNLNGVQQKAESANTVKLLSHAIKKDPTNPSFYNNLGVLLAGDYPEQAIGCFKKALEIKSDHSEARHNLSVVSARQL